MNKKKLILIISMIILGLGIIILFYYNYSLTKDAPVLFYDNNCPHCLVVKKFITDNNANFKNLKLKMTEISNKRHLNKFISVTLKCGLAQPQPTLPVLWTGKLCYSGEEQIINWLNNKSQQGIK